MTNEPEGTFKEQDINEIIAEYLDAERLGSAPGRSELVAQHPQFAEELQSFFADREQFQKLAGPSDTATIPPRPGTPADANSAETVAPGQAPTAGTTLRYFGDYELLDEIARGGMGVVYRAKQVSLNRIVALKMILAGQLAGEDDVKRFHTEAEAAANLQHPNIVGIHEVGEHGGQHYFSMDFVEGQNLADLIRDNPLSPEIAARYVQICADAIQYAHEQGTLHRDLKPANVLIDLADQPKITDFGLAKRMGGGRETQASERETQAGERETQAATHRADALTATGAVLGTPSYMPPEQASGERGAIGPASDVYSLGAILYELVTGRPPFRAANPLDTLLQVLETEAAPPRALNATISRDLETIILKCLNKEIKKRYATAQELADDLKAFREGRPIKARRPSLAERGMRWLGRQGPSVKIGLVAAVVLAMLAYGVWQYWDLQLGRVHFTSSGLPLVGEMLNENDDEAVSALFTIPTHSPLTLNPGDYRLKLRARQQLSETFHVQIDPGAEFLYPGGKQQHSIELKDRKLWDPIKIDRAFDMVTFTIPSEDGERTRQRADIIHFTKQGIERINGANGEIVWSAILKSQGRKSNGNNQTFNWVSFSAAAGMSNGQPTSDPRVLQKIPDVNGDGHADLVIAGAGTPSLITVSGADGKLLWWNRPLIGLPVGFVPEKADRVPFVPGVVVGLTIGDRGEPLPIAEQIPWLGFPFNPLMAAIAAGLQKHRQDASGPILIATMVSRRTLELRKDRVFGSPIHDKQVASMWIEAIAAQTGRTLWRHVLDVKGIAWHGGIDEYLGLKRARVLTIEGKPHVVCVAGNRVVFLDPSTGKDTYPARKIDGPGQASPRFADIDGKPGLEMLQWHKLRGSNDNNPKTVLRALSIPSMKLLWQETINARWWNAGEMRSDWAYRAKEQPQSPWPLLAPSNADKSGAMSVIIPDGNEIKALAGATGTVIWSSKTPTLTHRGLGDRRFQHSRRMSLGPDVDGDGHREIFQARIIERSNRRNLLLIEAISGKDGRTLWYYHRKRARKDVDGDWFQANRSDLRPLRWLPAGPDGWPVLIIPYVGGSMTQNTYLLSSATGKLLHEVPDLSCWFPSHDLDGDGLGDLIGWQRPEMIYNPRSNAYHYARFRGWLHSYHWYAPAVWRRLGEWNTTEDLNQDGANDLINRRNNYMTAVSGKDGLILWRSNEIGQYRESRATNNPHGPPAVSAPLPLGDVNEDGAPDLVVFAPQEMRWPDHRLDSAGNGPLCALCGKTGTTLWRCDALKSNREEFSQSFRYLGIHPLGGGMGTQVLLLYSKETRGAGMAYTTHLAAVSAKNGKLNWQCRVPRLDPHFAVAEPLLADVNGDGVDDVTFAVTGGPPVFSLDIINGKDGRSIGTTRHFRPSRQRSENHQYITAGDLDGDGKAEILVRCTGEVEDPGKNRFDDGFQGMQIGPQNGGDRQKKIKIIDGIYTVDGKNNKLRLWWKNTYPKAAPPQVLHGKGKSVVAVSVYNPKWRRKPDAKFNKAPTGKTGHKIVFLNGKANELAAAEIRQSIPYEQDGNTGHPASIWRHDVNGDGIDEVLVFKRGNLAALRADGSQLWESVTLGQNVEEIQFLKAKKGATVVAHFFGKVFGISGLTGKVQWRCDGPGRNVQVLPSNTHLQSVPRIISHVNHQPGQNRFHFTMCRLALPTDDDGNYLPEIKGKLHSQNEATFNELRMLPWVEDWTPRSGYLNRQYRDGLQYMNIGLFAFFVFSLWMFLSRGWRGLIVPFGLALVFSTAYAGLGLCFDRRFPGDQYVWNGWYVLFLSPTAIAGALFIPVMILYAVIWSVMRFIQRKTPATKKRRRVFRWVLLFAIFLPVIFVPALFLFGLRLGPWELIILTLVGGLAGFFILVLRRRPKAAS